MTTGQFPVQGPDRKRRRARSPETRPRAPRLAPGWEPTDLDRRYLSLLSRYEYLSLDLLVLAIGARPAAVRAKLVHLAGRGAVLHVREDRPHGRIDLWMPTPGGRRLSGTGLGRPSGGSPGLPPGMEESTMSHTLAVARVGLKLEGAGMQVWTEREIRLVDQPPIGARPDGPGRFSPLLATGHRHYPDLAVADRNGGLWGVEHEQSKKSAARLDGVLAAYARSRHHAGAVYNCTTDAIADRVLDSAARVGLPSARLQVLRPARPVRQARAA